MPSVNWAYNNRYATLLRCLEKNDYVYKPANTDSIFIIKPNGEKYFFIASGTINNKLDFQIPKRMGKVSN